MKEIGKTRKTDELRHAKKGDRKELTTIKTMKPGGI